MRAATQISQFKKQINNTQKNGRRKIQTWTHKPFSINIKGKPLNNDS